MASAIDFASYAATLRPVLEKAQAVTVVTHINPDADTIATGLGIYRILKQTLGIPVEIVNRSDHVPHHLDFLPGFNKIKRKSDYAEGVLIACDGADLSRFGIEAKGRYIVNIDHHVSNTRFGDLNVVAEDVASSGEAAFELFRLLYPIDAHAAQCFYTALFSDTRHFTTDSVDAETFRRANVLIALGADPYRTAYNLTQRKSLASLRLLQRALQSLHLYRDATVGVMVLTPEDFDATGAVMSDLDGIVDYAKSLATVDIGVLISEFDDGSVRVSLRSKETDVNTIAKRLGGGGHRHAAGVIVPKAKAQEILDTILHHISETKSEP